LAYVIYTSGTTGKPKGVEISHQASATRNLFMAKNGSVENNVYLAKTNYVFDVSVSDLFMHLLVGAKVVLTHGNFELDTLPEIIKLNGINSTHFVPSQLSAISSIGIDISSLETIYTSGENLEHEHISRLQGNHTLINYYGPTETGEATYHRITGDSDGSIIGRPFNGVRVYVLSDKQKMVPIGGVGELYISGVGQARAYLNRPELTSERFVFLDGMVPLAKGERLYRTGDLVRWLSNGTLQYLGRNDSQVKIRGFRIELTEIENTLMKHVDIKKAIVVTQEHNGQLCLVAYLVMNKKEINIEAIDIFLSHLLPDYMLPVGYVQLKSLPLTINGKLDRRALPACKFDNRFSYTAPRNRMEETLCEIWSEVLKRERTGIDDDFFKVGGSSLKVFMLRSIIRQRIALDIPVKVFYSRRTIRKMMDNVITERILCLEEEIAKMEEISFSAATIKNRDQNQRHILLIGATGFVGRYILHELLKDEEVNLTCLIRADSSKEGFCRLRRILENEKLWKEEYVGRISIVSGDLAQKRMGMTPKEYSVLSASVDTVFNCAVHMDHLATYDMMKTVNVDGTNNLLHFATHTRIKVFNTLSTIGVFNNHAQDIVEEDTPLNIQKHNSQNGYSSSKWVSEALVLRARAKGLITNIFRLGLVSGSSMNYKNDKNQWFGQLLRTCRITGFAFRGEDIDVSTIPVDFVAKAVIYLSRHFNGNGGNYHITTTSTYTLESLIERYNNLSNSKIHVVSFKVFIDELREAVRNNKNIPIPYFVKEYLDRGDIDSGKVHLKSESAMIKCESTMSILTKGGVVKNEISDDMIVNYIDKPLI
ncbi:non-ribosomal peptide synthetase, partial [Serratia fonticola]